ncbi:S-adenosyl-L-methionine-dependent methyltransferase [Aspergillus pseudoustus]|uniref:S-adenosyl-L-methionine-dependent methyltransferase n=1 Tax=Aspergillus pseudoustus TaxID=1810923 RepID=A0ABR4JKX5_9EURO
MSAGNERFNDEAADWDKNPSVQESSRLAFNALSPLIESLSAQKQHAATRAPVETAGLHVLEIGCGTGLLTVRVAPLVASVVAIDPAQGMIEALKAKIEAASSSTSTCKKRSDDKNADGPRRTTTPNNGKKTNVSNILPICHLLTSPEDPILPPEEGSDASGRRRKFDLIISHLVMHHVPDLRALLETLFGCLAPGGKVALTDYEDFGPQAIKFHPPMKMDGVERHGIPRVWIEGLIREVGFRDVDVSVRWRLKKSVEMWEGQELGDTMEFPFLLCEGVRPA